MKATKIIAVLAVALMAAGTVGLTSCKGKDKGKTASTKDAKGKKKGKAKKVELPEDAFDVKFTEDESGCIITSFHGDSEAVEGNDVTFPSTVQGLPVRGINCIEDVYRAASITIPEGVEWIDENDAGKGTIKDGITSVKLPSTLKIIGADTFSFVKSLSECNLPEGLIYIGKGAFDCSGLKSVTLPSSLKVINYNAFGSCDSLEEINIPDGLVIMHNGPFELFSGEKIEASLGLQKTIKDMNHKRVDNENQIRKILKDAGCSKDSFDATDVLYDDPWG
ncbi:MAG: leucine-rich repeat domain-containing protein [Treponema sp.]|nr:leucine-rich repeat domain-containing protein [Treponema sp.]